MYTNSWLHKLCSLSNGRQDVPFTLPTMFRSEQSLLAEIWGAGGGVNEGGATGGGGGGYSKVAIEVQSIGESFTIVTGQGGSRGDTVGTYGGGGAASRNSYWGSSGGGMSGIFSGSGLDNPLVISGGGGGATPGALGTANAGGGGAAGNPGNQRGNASDYAIAGAPGTLIAGGAAATNTSLAMVLMQLQEVDIKVDVARAEIPRMERNPVAAVVAVTLVVAVDVVRFQVDRYKTAAAAEALDISMPLK
jgi:hypothetical protein